MASAASAWHPLARGNPPPWANAWGHDRYGVWASFALGEEEQRVEQRMRWIRPGDFWMGSPDTEPGRYEDEGPLQPVRISRGFWMADTPCTQALWQAVMDSNPSRFSQKKESRLHPVEQVSFHDVEAFLKELAVRIPGFSARLPSEAEWEYACRAGSHSMMTYPLLGERSAAPRQDVAWFGDNSDADGSGASSQPVARKAPNAWGLYDMLGNVEEWCADGAERYDKHRPYSAELAVDPYQLPDERHASRVVRGGSWDNLARNVRAAYRYAIHPADAGVYLGFRLVRGQELPRAESAEQA